MVECEEAVKGSGRDLTTRLNNILKVQGRHDFRIHAVEGDEDSYKVVWEQAGYECD